MNAALEHINGGQREDPVMVNWTQEQDSNDLTKGEHVLDVDLVSIKGLILNFPLVQDEEPA